MDLGTFPHIHLLILGNKTWMFLSLDNGFYQRFIVLTNSSWTVLFTLARYITPASEYILIKIKQLD